MRKLIYILMLALALPMWGVAQQQKHRAVFPLGDFAQWMGTNIKFPQEALNDRVSGICQASFSITPNGQVKGIKVHKSPHWAISQEVERVLKLSPEWIPATQYNVNTFDKIDIDIDMSSQLTEEQLLGMTIVEQNTPAAMKGTQASISFDSFKRWIQEQYVIPEEIKGIATEATVTVSFWVQRDGSMRDVKVECDNEPLRKSIEQAVLKSDEWSPSTSDTVVVDSPVSFQLYVNIDQQGKEETPFTLVESMPTFKGGSYMSFRQWVASNLRYPAKAAENGIQGREVFSFVIGKDGELTNIKLIRSSNELLAREAMRVLQSSPRWKPGKQKGKLVRVKYTIPIDFKL